MGPKPCKPYNLTGRPPPCFRTPPPCFFRSNTCPQAGGGSGSGRGHGRRRQVRSDRWRL